jgi:hypothetical protein
LNWSSLWFIFYKIIIVSNKHFSIWLTINFLADVYFIIIWLNKNSLKNILIKLSEVYNLNCEFDRLNCRTLSLPQYVFFKKEEIILKNLKPNHVPVIQVVFGLIRLTGSCRGKKIVLNKELLNLKEFMIQVMDLTS